MKARYWFKQNLSGITLVTVLSIAAIAISQRYDGPVMLFAILTGLALHPAYESDSLKSGIHWCARPVLLIGVALLGFRININSLIELGYIIPLIMVGSIVATLLFGTIFSRAIGLPNHLGILISGAVSICGVSAAVAISTVLPRSKSHERDLALTVAGITVLSTLTMILYPILSEWLNHTERQAGFFIGASIHDVAQVVGAGYSISEKAGNSATLVKLIRVSSLLPVVIAVGWFFRDKSTKEKRSGVNLLPPFLVAYMLIAVANSFQVFPPSALIYGIEISKYCLIASLVAIGLKTDLKSIVSVGRAPLISLATVTLFLALITLILVDILI